MPFVVQGWLPDPRPQPPGHHQRQHSEITDKSPVRMSEGRGLVPFNQKVARPGKTVTDGDPQKRPPWMSRRKSQHDGQQAE